MKYRFFLFLIFITFTSKSQTINLNKSYLIDYLRISQLNGTFKSDFSFTQRPIHLGSNGLIIPDSIFNQKKNAPIISRFLKNKRKIQILPINYNSHHPYKNNNGSMIPNKGFQTLLSLGFYAEIGPLSIQIKPESLFAQNLNYPGFWEGHYDVIWRMKYNQWNQIDIPERFGEKSYKKSILGQSSIRLNYKGLSLGFSTENIWWGPSIRNSIMMSNNARGFKHITFNTMKPIKSPVGDFEWQVVTGRLEESGFTPPSTDRMYAGTKIYIPKINQMGIENDWRFFQGYSITYSPKWISGLSLGMIRWVQMYSALIKGEYTWMPGRITYFPAFSNLFRKNDKGGDLEAETDQAAGVFLRWFWEDSKAEIYAEFHYNDSKQNIRDLLLDSDHANATTLGLQKVFSSKRKNTNYLFSWEWTRLEQTASRLVRNAGSWYNHYQVYDGYTNYGEVIGAAIGPGSNSNYFSVSMLKGMDKYGLSFEIIDQNNDFYYYAFEDSSDFRRYWKDYNIHLNIDKKFKNISTSINIVYSRSLNYQWEIDPLTEPYYHPGKDVDNFHFSMKFEYNIPFVK